MKPSMKFLFTLLFMFSASSLRGEEGYPDFTDPLEGLVYGGSNDSYSESDEARMVREKAIAEFPGAKERLFQFVERDRNVSKIFEFVPKSMKAISLRHDVTQDDLKEIDREMSLAASRSPRLALDGIFLFGGISIFEAFPNQEREQLILRLAYDEDMTLAQAALRALVKMGNPHAGKALDDAIQKTVIPGVDQSLDQNLGEMRELKRQVELQSGQKGKKETSAESAVATPTRKMNELETSSERKGGQVGISKTATGIVLVVIVTGLLWRLLKKRDSSL